MATVEHQGGRQHPTDANKHQYYHHQNQNQNPSDAIKNLLPNKGPSTSQVLAVVTLVPLGGILLTLSGLTLTGTLIGLALATPVFVIFSPVLVPAALVVALAVAGFLTSGAFGLSGLSSLSWIVNFMRGMNESAPEQMEYAKRRMQDAAGYVGQRTKDLGQEIQKKGGQEGGRGGHEGGRTGHEGGKA